jgi:glycosyltransferase involved in cell wall biosynthesis
VDDNSPEGEDAIVEEFQRRYDNIRSIRTPARIGIYPAWNLAVRASSGAFLTPMSTNDRLAPDAYERLLQALEKHPEAGLAYGDSYLTNIPHQVFGRHTPSPDYGGEFKWPPYSYEDLLVNCRVGPHPLWRKSLHAEVGYFDGRYKAIGDQDFWLRIALKHPLVHIPVYTGLAWITKDSLSGQGSSLQEIFDIHNKHTIAHLDRLKGLSPVPALGRR